jgi:integrase/recombinase XerD
MSLDYAGRLRTSTDARHDLQGERCLLRHYSTRGVRALLERYAKKTGLTHNMPPHRLRHFLFTWLKEQGIDDALIQPYSGHASRTSLEIYSQVSLAKAQGQYDAVIDQFPV